MCLQWVSQVALAQVMTRLKLTWIGRPGSAFQSRETFKMAQSFTAFLLALNTILISTAVLNVQVFGALPVLNIVLGLILNGGCLCCYFVLVFRTRAYFRKQFGIPESSFFCSEDIMMSLACSSCVVMQMGRHTARYELYQASCCTKVRTICCLRHFVYFIWSLKKHFLSCDSIPLSSSFVEWPSTRCRSCHAPSTSFHFRCYL